MSNPKAHALVKNFYDCDGENEGEEIYGTIDAGIDIFMEYNLPCPLKKGDFIYRAREVKCEDLRDYQRGNDSLGINVYYDKNGKLYTAGYNEEQSMEAPIESIKAGRANREYESYLYTAKEVVTACAEIKSSAGGFISLAKIKVIGDLRIFDLSSEMYTSKDIYGVKIGDIYTEISRLFHLRIEDPQKYKATQKISEYIKDKEYDGISYRSDFTSGTSYVVMTNDRHKTKYIGSRLIFKLDDKGLFYDFNSEELLSSDDFDLGDCKEDELITMAKNKIKPFVKETLNV